MRASTSAFQAILAPLFILFLVLGPFALAASDSAATPESAPGNAIEKFTVDGKAVEFVTLKDRSATLSRSCIRRPKQEPHCDAYRKLKAATLQGLEEELNGGANPGAVACGHLGGTVVVGFTEKKDENSFCKFKDGSMVSNGSLHYHAMENDEHRKAGKKSE